MAGYQSRDGKIAGNRQLVESHDRNQGKRSSHMGMEKLKGATRAGSAGEGMRGGGADHEEVKSVVAEHGPAHSHHISKGRAGGFHSRTEHESGHVHDADHESLADAHQHGIEAMGEGEGGDDALTSSMLPIDESEAGDKDDAGGPGFMRG